MFNVGRYDPDAEDRRAAKRKEPPSHHTDNLGDKTKPLSQEKPSSLRVIANETVPVSLFHNKLPTDEALDDFDILGDLIENDPPYEQHPPTSSTVEHGQVSQNEVQAALRIAEMPIEQAAKGWKLAPFLLANLQERDKFTHFFPIQALAIPDVIASERHYYVQASDICITAPTGSGKTLAYALPILNSLAAKSSSPDRRRLRALVVLPSRDLATQVHRVFERYVVGSQLKVGLAIGQSDFVAEQKALTVDPTSTQPDRLLHRLTYYDPNNLELALQIFRDSSFPPVPQTSSASSSSRHIPADGWSNVDVLVCTPGRLVDHLDHTPGFTLQHLLFLVVDEADRLLNQSYHNWIDRVLEASIEASVSAWKNIVAAGNNNNGELPPLQLSPDLGSVVLEPITWRRGGTARDALDSGTFNTNDLSSTVAKVCQPVQLRKFLVSATLTLDPQKLAALRLVNPRHFNVHQLKQGERNLNKYSMPTSLEEYTVECTAEQKPLVLLSLLLDHLQQTTTTREREHSKSMIVVFTASLDSTHRLARLLQLLLWAAQQQKKDDGNKEDTALLVVGEFSSSLNQQERAALVERCNDPTDSLSVVVCSDGMSRGIDIEYLDAVINYDVPTLAKTYVHRCGRTARASRKGTAITLLKGGQMSLFFRMRRLILAHERVESMPVKKNLVRDAVDLYYKHCVKALRDVLDAEGNGELGHTASLEDYLPEI